MCVYMKLAFLALKQRRMLFNLIKSDFKNRYLGNHLGIIWAVVQPLVLVAVYWFVFTKGLRVEQVSDVPFVLWLLAGLVPWFLMSDAITSSASSLTSQSFLVKKIVFEVKLLPLVKIGSAFIVNLAFWLLLVIVSVLYHDYPTLMWLQLFYYLFCAAMISLALGLLFSALMPFIPDVAQLIAMVFQVLFWATPILWNPAVVAGTKYWWIVSLNPFAYVTAGVRDSIIYQVPFWQHPLQTLYFWGFVLVVFWFANRTFNKLRPHFADVL